MYDDLELTYENIVGCCVEALEQGDSCEVFFVNEHPEVEGYLLRLKSEFDWEYSFHKDGEIRCWMIHFN